ncbi:hypothetical protein AK88_04692 [Plasmodium fragile]|uniref:Plasmodium RESA N-terminal domain-containing protein n=1 Tax=Plasmodium fragile TaxID=5857 RepID=A0A0D9QIX8_PLAFR|nr:uncharacterized protein AK88_04692 [Plasmodium fragile]KJP85661.1 hypothetical protein AK88_04692 [Plasmodium fragile]
MENIIIFIRYRIQHLTELGSPWNHTAEQNDTLGVRISRLLTVELDMQAPEQSNKLPGSPSGCAFKEPLVQVKKEPAKDQRPFLRGEAKVPGAETTQESDEQVQVKRHDVLADAIYDDVSTVPKAHDALDNDNKKRQMTENKRKEAAHTIEKYEGKVAEDREKYGIHRSTDFHYEMSCFDERLRDSEINKKLEQMEEEPHKSELLSLYWQSFINERFKYIDAKKRLFKKFLELKKKQTNEIIPKDRKKWGKCGRIVGNNFKKQREHVHEVFYTMVAKEKLSRDEFKKILNDISDSWKQVTTKTEDACMAIIGEPISLEVIYVPNDPRNIGLSVPGFTVPGMPYGSRVKSDSKHGSEGLFVASEKKAQGEKMTKESTTPCTALKRTLIRYSPQTPVASVVCYHCIMLLLIYIGNLSTLFCIIALAIVSGSSGMLFLSKLRRS